MVYSRVNDVVSKVLTMLDPELYVLIVRINVAKSNAHENRHDLI